jgi:hypothetical protein
MKVRTARKEATPLGSSVNGRLHELALKAQALVQHVHRLQCMRGAWIGVLRHPRRKAEGIQIRPVEARLPSFGNGKKW